jgi:adenosylcobinamide-GDP ribazoletransferase
MTTDLFGLLTRIRVSGAGTDLQRAAREQHLFPLVGLVIGLIAAVAAILLNGFLGEDKAIVSGAVLLVVLYLVTGILHTEGLADFADGAMASGTKERKREVMKDVHSGAAAIITVNLYLLLLFGLAVEICFRARDTTSIFPLPWGVVFALGFVLSEMAGKVAMNVVMYLGPSSHPGMGSLFVGEAKPDGLLISLAIAGAAAFLIAGYLFFIVYLGVVAGLVVTMLARKNFGGVSGDAFGAANEIGRLLTLLAWVLVF